MSLLFAMVWGEGDDQLWGSGRCWVPLQGAIVVCYGWGRHFFFILRTQKLFFCYLGSMLV